MLIQFEVENYRSVKEPITLQLTAINYYKENQDSLIKKKIPGMAGIDYLRSAAIYGPNASGKTTVFKAIEEMKQAVLYSAQRGAEAPLPYSPFLLDNESQKHPSKFSAAFVTKGVRYEYSFSLNNVRFIEEQLLAFPNGYKQVWFTRKDGKVKDSTYVHIPASLKPLLNDNALLLSLLANYPKLEGAEKILPVFEWFKNGLMLLDRGPNAVTDFPISGDIVAGESGTDFQREFIQQMIRLADIGINDARVEKNPAPKDMMDDISRLVEAIGLPGVDEITLPEELKTVLFSHPTDSGSRSFPLSEESDGTVQLFSLSGPIAQALEKGAVIFVDELDKSLHPTLVKEIVRCFLDPSVNKMNAQLVFTAHNPCLLENGLLRRDQIWFTEKTSDGSTRLYPLSEYSPRKDEAISTGYLIGRYSAVPIVPDCFGLCGSCSSEVDEDA